MDKISEVASCIREAEGQITFIIGAGASKSAGIPMAEELIQRACTQFSHCISGLSDSDKKHYGKVMRKLSPDERKRLIEPILKASKINWGHIALSALLERGKVERVLTFNFDLILERAVSLLGLQLPVYDFGVAPTKAINLLARPAIVHLHGQSSGLVLLNTDAETTEHKEALRPLFRDTLHKDVTIVIGYSGLADGAFDVLKEEFSASNKRIIWLGHSQEAPSHLGELLKNDYADYIGGCDFDQTMIELARLLGVWPPSITKNPMKHLLSELSHVTEFPQTKDVDTDVLSVTRTRLENFSEKWEAGENDETKIYDQVLIGDGNTITLDAKRIGKIMPRGQKALAWLFVSQATRQYEAAKLESGETAAAKFNDAYSGFKQAIEIEADMHEAFNNWGNALSDEAKTHVGETASGKFAEAYEKYAKAVAIKLDKHIAFFNWGSALCSEATTLVGEAASAKFAEAYEKYARAVAIKPEYHDAFNSWAIALSEEAKTLQGNNASAKFAEAYEKFDKAVAIKPDNYETFSNWGTVLCEEAQKLQGDAAGFKFAEAYEKYAIAVAIKPEDHESFDSWAIALSNEARMLQGYTASAKFAEAYEKFAKAVAIKPDQYKAFCNWGTALYEEAQKVQGDVASAKFAEAHEKYAKAVAIKPDDHEAFNSWGNALSQEAKMLQGTSASAKFAEAYENYAKAVAIKPDLHDAFENWGGAMLDEAKMLEGEAALAKVSASIEICQLAKKISGKGEYNLACGLALSFHSEEALGELKQCFADGTLPEKAHLESDDDLNSLRSRADFKKLIADLSF